MWRPNSQWNWHLASKDPPVTLWAYLLPLKKHSITANFQREVSIKSLPQQNLGDFCKCLMSNIHYITKYFLIMNSIPTLCWTNYSFPGEKTTPNPLKFPKLEVNVSSTHLPWEVHGTHLYWQGASHSLREATQDS